MMNVLKLIFLLGVMLETAACHSAAWSSKAPTSLFERLVMEFQTSYLQNGRNNGGLMKPHLFSQLKLGGEPREVFAVTDETSRTSLAVNFFNDGQVSLKRISNVSELLSNSSGQELHLQTMAEHMGWPQTVGEVYSEYLPKNQPPFWFMTTGFYQEDKTDGQIVLLPLNNIDSAESFPIMMTPQEAQPSWIYWNVEWNDMDGDGWSDIVASRSQGEIGKIQTSEIVWLKNPGTFAPTENIWSVHPITTGPDVNFRIMKVSNPNGTARTVIIGLGYWNHKLYAIWTEDENEDWSKVDLIKERVIGNHSWFWDIQIADLNGDGRDDILVSTYAMSSWRSSLFVFEIPCDITRDEWRKHTIIEGGSNMSDEPFNSCGKIKVFHPLVRDSSSYTSKKKPHIVLSGDNDGFVKVLYPTSKSASSWIYGEHMIFKADGPVGPIALEDLDHDGYIEVVVPVMKSRRLLFFTFKPGTNPLTYSVTENGENIDWILANNVQ